MANRIIRAGKRVIVAGKRAIYCSSGTICTLDTSKDLDVNLNDIVGCPGHTSASYFNDGLFRCTWHTGLSYWRYYQLIGYNTYEVAVKCISGDLAVMAAVNSVLVYFWVLVPATNMPQTAYDVSPCGGFLEGTKAGKDGHTTVIVV